MAGIWALAVDGEHPSACPGNPAGPNAPRYHSVKRNGSLKDRLGSATAGDDFPRPKGIGGAKHPERDGSVLRKAHFQRLPDGGFRIQHQAGLGNYHIREFNEKDQSILATWRVLEFSRLELDLITRESVSDVTVNRRKLNYTLIPEIKLEEGRLENVIRFIKTYAESGAQKTGTVIDIGAQSVVLRDPSKVRSTEPQG